MKIYFKQLFFVLVSVLVLASCGNTPAKKGRVVTVTIEPLRYFASQIAGSRFDVVTMVPGDGNPETYEPSAQQMVNLSQSDLYIKVGSIGFERTWMKKLEANAPHAIVVDSSQGIEMLKTPAGTPDPHTWMSAANARIIAQNIYRALASIDTRDSAYFRENLETLLAHIDSVDCSVRQLITKDKSQTFLIYHPILTYFARDYGLKQIPMEEEGREPSAAQLQATIDEANREGVKTFFVQRQFANRNVSVVAKATKTEQIEINPLGFEWDKEMIKIAKLLK